MDPDVQQPPPVPDFEHPEEPERDGPAWEWRRELGTWRALRLTIQEVLTQPSETFRRMRLRGDSMTPIGFYLIMEVAVSFVSFLVFLPIQMRMMGSAQAWVNENLISQMPAEAQVELGRVFSEHSSASSMIVSGLTSIFFGVIVTLAVVTIVTHAALALLGGARNGLGATLRATAYSGGATCIVQLIPLVGSLVQLVLWPVIFIVALTEAHQTQAWRATLAVILPGLILIVCLLLLVVLALVWAASMAGTI